MLNLDDQPKHSLNKCSLNLLGRHWIKGGDGQVYLTKVPGPEAGYRKGGLGPQHHGNRQHN